MDSVSAWETSSSSGGTPRLRELHHLKPAQRAVDKRHVATRVEHLGQPENIPRAKVGRRRDAERVGEYLSAQAIHAAQGEPGREGRGWYPRTQLEEELDPAAR